NRPGQGKIVALPGTVTVHRRKQDLPGPQCNDFLCVSNGIEPGRVSSAMREDFPAVVFAHLRYLLRINRNHNALIAEFFRGFFHEGPPVDCGRVDRNLVGAAGEELADIVNRAYPAADGERHKACFRRTRHDVVDRVAFFMACGDIEKTKFVRAGCVVGNGSLDRISSVAKIYELDALNHAAVFYIEAGNDADLEHQPVPAVLSKVSASVAFSRPS